MVMAAALVAPAAPVSAQQARAEPRSSPARIAMWVLAGATIGAAAYALHHSDVASERYEGLRSLCSNTPASCTISGSSYPDARAEGLYQSALQADRRARAGIISGQLSLAGSAGLFIRELRQRGGRAPNIPYEPLPSPRESGAAIGILLNMLPAFALQPLPAAPPVFSYTP
jgi:hypothetical protein